jgi:ankyrin repeat protein
MQTGSANWTKPSSEQLLRGNWLQRGNSFDQGANIDARDKDDDTALHMAALEGY